MRRAYLGDASDHWKGSLHEHLRAQGHVKNLHAIGMFADGPWHTSEVVVYAGLLRLVGPHAVVDADLGMPGGHRRRDHFDRLVKSVPPDADILVDPDTGIKEQLTTSKAHVSVRELGALLQGSRVLMVFDESHDRRIDKSVHVRQLAQSLMSLKAHVVAYESGRGVTLFYVSKDLSRVADIGESLANWLGPATSRRVTTYTGPTSAAPIV